MSASLEVERTLDVPVGWSPPTLDGPSGVDGVSGSRDLASLTLDATYLDTPRLALLRRGITLRRRVGGDDEGWHLKLPAGDGRTEVRAPLGPADDEAPPAELAALVDGVRLGAALRPVARLRTERATTLLLGPGGDVLASVAVDDVLASTERGDEAWREVEVELVDGDTTLLGRVVDRLEESGANPAPLPVKLERALGLGASWYGGRPATVPPTTGAELVTRYLREQVDALLDADPRVRRDEPDAVHAARVAARRLRSTLRTFRPVLDRDTVEPVRDELRWWGGALGAARDHEVQRDRVRGLLDGLPDELVVGPVRARLADALDAGYRTAVRDAVELMDSDRYRALLSGLDALADDPPVRERAGEPAPDVAARVVRHAFRRARRRMEAGEVVLAGLARATGSDSVPPTDPAEPGTRGPDATAPRLADAMHDARKKLKAARYAAEAAVVVAGEPAARLADALEDVQDVLGAHHDAVVLAGLFRELGMRAHLSGENAFTYGLLVGLERARAQAALADAHDAWASASRRRLRRWTR
ncbi:CHAD domain-containing protein [Luteimicrobium sp. DT211]|uniref:CYTH and CHAD domain-containing protein n=1 Tax=Luteimicrobium sp. DT211 TaxID=3393412 RepID=UPI003CEC2728